MAAEPLLRPADAYKAAESRLAPTSDPPGRLKSGLSGWTLISEVLVGSVADSGRIQKDDAIVGVNGTRVSSQPEIEAYLRAHKMKQGDEVIFTVERQGKTLEKRVKYPVIPQRTEKEKKEPPREETTKTKLL